MQAPAQEPARQAEPTVDDAQTTEDPQSAAGFADGGALPAISTDWADADGAPSASDQAYGSPLLASAGEQRMSSDDFANQRMQPGLDSNTVEQRRKDLRAVFGVGVDFQHLADGTGMSLGEVATQELPNIAKLGARFIRVDVPVGDPSAYERFKGVLEAVAAFNQQNRAQAIRIDLLANPAVTDFTLDGAASQGGAGAAQVRAFVEFCGAPLVAASVASVELYNEPEAQWKDTGLDAAGAAQRDSTIVNTAMAGLEGQLPGGVAVTPVAHEWDPASEQAPLAQVASQIDAANGDPATLESLAADAIGSSDFALRLAQYAADYRGRKFPDTDPAETVEIPLSLHIYNNPLFSRGLIDAVAAIAERANAFFQIRVTEFQIDAAAHDHPTQQQVADGVVDLGVQVMDAAAAHGDRLRIQQMIAFSYHHNGANDGPDKDGTDFGLRGNQPLADTLGVA